MEPQAYIGIDARIWQALIAGGVVALGWLVNGWSQRRDARRLRAEKLRDAHKALFAEIRDICAAYWHEGEAELVSAALIARMEEDADFVPFVPRERHGPIFEAMIDQIDVLPRQTIDWIVAFYAMVRSIEALAEDMRGSGYAGLGQARRIAVYRDYMSMREQGFVYGQNALRLIEAYSSGGPEAVSDALARSGISSPDAGRSAQGRRED